MDFTQKLSCLIFILCMLISMKNQYAETNKDKGTTNQCQSANQSSSYSNSSGVEIPKVKMEKEAQEIEIIPSGSLRLDYYSVSCPNAESIIRLTIKELYALRPEIAPALLRLVFHDCFIHGCDASVLLDAVDGVGSEKDVPPNESLKGYDIIDIIKSKLENECPGVVSCADIIILAARESVYQAGGPFYPLYTGRRDSMTAFPTEATFELPSPHDNLAKVVQSFGSRGFDQREMVSLLGAHSIGTIHCKFFNNRLYNFNGTNQPDPSIDSVFLNQLRYKCSSRQNQSSVSPSLSPMPSSSSSPSPLASSSSPSATSSMRDILAALLEEPGMKMDYEGRGKGFGLLYYRGLLQKRGLLYVDQQMTAGDETKDWVRAYASDLDLFHKDFAQAMIKLSNHRVLEAPMGQVRTNCRKVA